MGSPPDGEVNSIIDGFNRVLSEAFRDRPGGLVTLKRYQVSVARELIGLIEGGHRFIVVSMPTGSGKTFVEMLSAYYAINRRYGRVLVLEPTRFLCDQMFRRLWSRVFGGIVGVDYEGRCDDSFDLRKRIVIATPRLRVSVRWRGLSTSLS